MRLHEKIRSMRQQQGWSQEQMADKLNMSVSGYAHIERGETDVQLSRLEQIAKVFGMDLLELLNFGEKNIVCFAGDNNSQHIWQILDSKNSQEIAHELEKCRLLNVQKDMLLEQKDNEINYLRDLIQKLTKKDE
ncbi:MAG: helix-turn-helix transcriptional regulator [Thiotrichaceae bacterium]